jgi:CBS domain containing-hemolysin-like protein
MLDGSTFLSESVDGVAGMSVGHDLLLLVVYVLLALCFSFLCSIAEAALLSITPSFIAGLKEKEPAKAKLIRKLREENLDRSLAAILTLNTAANTVGAIGAGSKATAVFGKVWFGVFSAVMTFLILFLSEIVPKTLGATYWRQLAGFTAFFVRLLTRALFPLLAVAERLTRWLSRGRRHSVFSRDEFVAMAGVGQEQGFIGERESKIIRNLFLFKSVDASAIMTPRTVLAALSKDMTVTEALKVPRVLPFSRIPIYEQDLDGIIGFVLRADLLLAQSEGRGEVRISELSREIMAVLPTTPLLRLLEILLEQRQHVAIVVGEYGETRGLVTLEDLVETLLGIEILDEGDRVEDMQALARKIWARRAKRFGLATPEA